MTSELETAFLTGLEACLEQPPGVFQNARLGLLANQASVDRRFRYSWDLLSERFPDQLAALFSPQHGLWCEQQANMVETPHGFHSSLEIPLHSLYSETRRPTPEMLEGCDVLVVDLQDVGTRIYTFGWTVSHCLEACAELGVPVVVLDRPNPIGGVAVEGPLLDPRFASFVGRTPIPMRHGLTIGELSILIDRQLDIGADLLVVPMQGWSRSMHFRDTGRDWLPPSPNLPRLEGVDTYPGLVLLEGTNLSEGRGTTIPFELSGAPFIDSDLLARRLSEVGLPGIVFRPVRFVPEFDKWRGIPCGGVGLHVVDRQTFQPYRTGVALLTTVKHLYPSQFAWLNPPYEYEQHHMPIDILSGSDQLRLALDDSPPVEPALLDQLCGLDQTAWQARHLYR